jgi:hypothetical protein
LIASATVGVKENGSNRDELQLLSHEGVDRDGRPYVLMPSDVFHHLSDADAGSMVAYLR